MTSETAIAAGTPLASSGPMGLPRRLWIGLTGNVAWRLPGWPARMVSSFRDTEHCSAVDVLSACELTTRRDLRGKYLRHALDEARHARLFAARAQALGAAPRPAPIEGGKHLLAHGVVDGRTLYERLGEQGFLAFVYVAEAEACEQFGLYVDQRLPDAETTATLSKALGDEHFHVEYSKRALEQWERAEGRAVRTAVFTVWANRWKERWLRSSHTLGEAVSSVWLWLLYATFAPFRLVARPEAGGWRSSRPETRPVLAAARSQA